jgi:transcription antitermination factor NusG
LNFDHLAIEKFPLTEAQSARPLQAGGSRRKFKLSYQKAGSVSLGRPFGPLPCRNDRIELAGARQAQAVRKADGRMRKHHQVREGQIVRVIDGPLTGFRGEVKEVDEQTAKVAVQVFSRVTPMDLALGQIELVPEDSN